MSTRVWRITLGSLGLAGAFASFWLGHERGIEEATVSPAKCPDRSFEARVLAKVVHDAAKNTTTCTYESVTGATFLNRA
jgi:hypothetical protein